MKIFCEQNMFLVEYVSNQADCINNNNNFTELIKIQYNIYSY
jgi:hypothetical protein